MASLGNCVSPDPLSGTLMVVDVDDPRLAECLTPDVLASLEQERPIHHGEHCGLMFVADPTRQFPPSNVSPVEMAALTKCEGDYGEMLRQSKNMFYRSMQSGSIPVMQCLELGPMDTLQSLHNQLTDNEQSPYHLLVTIRGYLTAILQYRLRGSKVSEDTYNLLGIFCDPDISAQDLVIHLLQCDEDTSEIDQLVYETAAVTKTKSRTGDVPLPPPPVPPPDAFQFDSADEEQSQEEEEEEDTSERWMDAWVNMLVNKAEQHGIDPRPSNSSLRNVLKHVVMVAAVSSRVTLDGDVPASLRSCNLDLLIKLFPHTLDWSFATSTEAATVATSPGKLLHALEQCKGAHSAIKMYRDNESAFKRLNARHHDANNTMLWLKTKTTANLVVHDVEVHDQQDRPAVMVLPNTASVVSAKTVATCSRPIESSVLHAAINLTGGAVGPGNVPIQAPVSSVHTSPHVSLNEAAIDNSALVHSFLLPQQQRAVSKKRQVGIPVAPEDYAVDLDLLGSDWTRRMASQLPPCPNDESGYQMWQERLPHLQVRLRGMCIRELMDACAEFRTVVVACRGQMNDDGASLSLLPLCNQAGVVMRVVASYPLRCVTQALEYLEHAYLRAADRDRHHPQDTDAVATTRAWQTKQFIRATNDPNGIHTKDGPRGRITVAPAVEDNEEDEEGVMVHPPASSAAAAGSAEEEYDLTVEGLLAEAEAQVKAEEAEQAAKVTAATADAGAAGGFTGTLGPMPEDIVNNLVNLGLWYMVDNDDCPSFATTSVRVLLRVLQYCGIRAFQPAQGGIHLRVHENLVEASLNRIEAHGLHEPSLFEGVDMITIYDDKGNEVGGSRKSKSSKKHSGGTAAVLAYKPEIWDPSTNSDDATADFMSMLNALCTTKWSERLTKRALWRPDAALLYNSYLKLVCSAQFPAHLLSKRSSDYTVGDVIKTLWTFLPIRSSGRTKHVAKLHTSYTATATARLSAITMQTICWTSTIQPLFAIAAGHRVLNIKLRSYVATLCVRPTRGSSTASALDSLGGGKPKDTESVSMLRTSRRSKTRQHHRLKAAPPHETDSAATAKVYHAIDLVGPPPTVDPLLSVRTMQWNNTTIYAPEFEVGHGNLQVHPRDVSARGAAVATAPCSDMVRVAPLRCRDKVCINISENEPSNYLVNDVMQQLESRNACLKPQAVAKEPMVLMPVPIDRVSPKEVAMFDKARAKDLRNRIVSLYGGNEAAAMMAPDAVLGSRCIPAGSSAVAHVLLVGFSGLSTVVPEIVTMGSHKKPLEQKVEVRLHLATNTDTATVAGVGTLVAPQHWDPVADGAQVAICCDSNPVDHQTFVDVNHYERLDLLYTEAKENPDHDMLLMRFGVDSTGKRALVTGRPVVNYAYRVVLCRCSLEAYIESMLPVPAQIVARAANPFTTGGGITTDGLWSAMMSQLCGPNHVAEHDNLHMALRWEQEVGEGQTNEVCRAISDAMHHHRGVDLNAAYEGRDPHFVPPWPCVAGVVGERLKDVVPWHPYWTHGVQPWPRTRQDVARVSVEAQASTVDQDEQVTPVDYVPVTEKRLLTDYGRWVDSSSLLDRCNVEPREPMAHVLAEEIASAGGVAPEGGCHYLHMYTPKPVAVVTSGGGGVDSGDAEYMAVRVYDGHDTKPWMPLPYHPTTYIKMPLEQRLLYSNAPMAKILRPEDTHDADEYGNKGADTSAEMIVYQQDLVKYMTGRTLYECTAMLHPQVINMSLGDPALAHLLDWHHVPAIMINVNHVKGLPRSATHTHTYDQDTGDAIVPIVRL